MGGDGEEGEEVNKPIWDDGLHKRFVKDRKKNKSSQISDVCGTSA